MAGIGQVSGNLNAAFGQGAPGVRGRGVEAEAAGVRDSVQISSEAAGRAKTRTHQAGQAVMDIGGRTPVQSLNMKSLAPPDAGGKALSRTTPLLDGRVAGELRVPNIDITPGGPNAARILDGSPLLNGPKLAEDPNAGAQGKTQPIAPEGRPAPKTAAPTRPSAAEVEAAQHAVQAKTDNANADKAARLARLQQDSALGKTPGITLDLTA